MKLRTASVRRYRSIEDGSEFELQDDVTCLVGKNESGKSALLQSLYKSNPVVSDVTFDTGLDYPSRLTRETRRDPGPLQVTRLTYELSADDIEHVETRLGAGVLPSSRVTATTGYRYGPTIWSFEADEAAAAAHLRRDIDLPAEEQQRLDGTVDIRGLLAVLEAVETPSAAVNDALATVAGWKNRSVKEAIIQVLAPRCPKFVYFADYDTMPGLVSIPDLIARQDAGTLNRGQQAVVSLLDMASVQLEDFTDPESSEHLVRMAENASNSISEEVFEYWSQNTSLAVQMQVLDRVDPAAPAELRQPPLLQIRVRNERHRVTVPFDERSRGFVWFFSFLAYFSELEQRAEQPLILLLDEPGINLHASAQADLLRFIDERLAPNHQVLFTTHSPFMVDPHRLERIRTVVDVDGEGTKVSAEVLHTDAETAFPLHAALGVELAQTLFVAPNTLLVEGPSDLIYLDVLSNRLREAGRTGLDERWALTPVAGAGKLPAFLTLLRANKLNIAVVADSSLENDAAIKKLREAGRLGAAGVVSIGEILGRDRADVEDLFDTDLYLELVNDAYAGALQGTPLTMADLPDDARLVRRVERALQARGAVPRTMNHMAPASALLRRQAEFVPRIGEATLSHAEDLFARLNVLAR